MCITFIMYLYAAYGLSGTLNRVLKIANKNHKNSSNHSLAVRTITYFLNLSCE